MLIKKIASLLLISTFVLTISACTIPGTDITFDIPFLPGSDTTGDSTVKEPVTLTYWGLFEPYEMYEPLISEYEELNPHVTIVYEEKDYDNLDLYKDTVLSKLQLNESTPDIVRLHSTWVKGFSSNLEPAPKDTVTPAAISNDFYTTVSSDVIINNQVYGVPLMYDSLALFYNRDIFQQANVAPPTSWSEFSDIASTLTTRDKNTILVSGAAFGSAENVSSFSDVISLLVMQSNLQLPQDFQSPAMKEAITYYTNFVKTLQVWDRTQAYSPVAFASGRVAMMFGPSWQLLNIIEANPQLNVGVAPVPQLVTNGAYTQNNVANYWVESVNPNSQNSTEAWRFLAWLSEPEQLQKLFDSASSRRVFGSAYPRVSMQNTLVSNSFLAPYYSYADSAQSTKFADGSGNSAYVEILKNVIEGVLNGGDMDALLTTAQQEYSRLEQQGF